MTSSNHASGVAPLCALNKQGLDKQRLGKNPGVRDNNSTPNKRVRFGTVN
jgi:hypothetical protein